MTRIDPALPHAWLAARSLARGLPAPVPDHGGFRVDTDSETEARRWVFPHVTEGLVALGRTISAPAHFLKLCGSPEDMRAALAEHWRLEPVAWFMTTDTPPAARRLPTDYTLAIEERDAVSIVRIWTNDGTLAASGYAAETEGAFIYDRIITDPAHFRKGLGSVVMASLGRARRSTGNPQLLVATDAGRALYATLGWRVISPFVTASIAEM